MTTTTARRDIHEGIASARDTLTQAALQGAAIRGELGTDAQILALSEQYKRLQAAGQTEAAAAVKAQAYAIYEETRR